MSGRAAKPRVKYDFATRLHGFPTKSKALAREIPPATQATNHLVPFGSFLTGTATRTLLNKGFHWRAFEFLVHFFAVLCKTTTCKDQMRCLKNVNRDGSFVKFLSNLSLCQFRGSFDNLTRNKFNVSKLSRDS